ncbi:unnamed protein product [Linum tenue]|uniref:EGF-like domain-containing protein n=1 Tax=Linum tenue TaxID=586396 RepID=A0AAV0IM46_9ROSI|nr:unnamed protein product [Linum tenue]
MEKTTLPTTAINLLQFLLPLITSLSPTYTNVIHLGCSNRCGGVAVPYPFAIGDPKCAFSDAFLLNCSSTAPPQLLLGNIPVTNISVEEGTFSVVFPAAYSCYGRTGSPMKDSRVRRPHVNLGSRRPFRFSDVHNKLTAFGCGAQALITNEDGGSGCVSVCGTASSLPVVCPGIGCCQSPIPQGLKTIEFATSSTSNHSGRVSGSSNPCSYAYLADDRFSDFGGVNLAEFPERNPGNSIAAIEWVVEEKTCEAAMWNSSTFPCRKDSDCVYSKNGNGYRCSCKPGFRGNPYFGCQGKKLTLTSSRI